MNNKDIFKDKVVIVTGGGQGLGRELCFDLSKRGAIVICTDKTLELAQNTTDFINNEMHNSTTTALKLDVADHKQLSSFVTSVRSKYKTIDYLFNNAGIAIAGEIHEYNISHWKKIIDVNLFGLVFLSTEIYKVMREQKHGHIVNITSISGLLEYSALNTPYAVSKHGAVTFSKALALEAKDYGIKVTTVCPGSIITNMVKNMEYINFSKDEIKSSEKFMAKGISAQQASKHIIAGIIKNKSIIIFPKSFRKYYRLSRIFKSLEKTITQKYLKKHRAEKV